MPDADNHDFKIIVSSDMTYEEVHDLVDVLIGNSYETDEDPRNGRIYADLR